jgi:hypothetical protein
MDKKNADDLELIWGMLAIAHKDVKDIHKRLNGGDGALPVGIAERHLAQAVMFLQQALKPTTPTYTDTEASEFMLGLNSGNDS